MESSLFKIGRKLFREQVISMFPPAHLKRKRDRTDYLKLWHPELWDMRIWKNCPKN